MVFAKWKNKWLWVYFSFLCHICYQNRAYGKDKGFGVRMAKAFAQSTYCNWKYENYDKQNMSLSNMKVSEQIRK